MAALRAFARFNDAIFGFLKRRKSEAMLFLGSLGVAVSFRGDGGDAIARLALPEDYQEARRIDGTATRAGNGIVSCTSEARRQAMIRPDGRHG